MFRWNFDRTLLFDKDGDGGGSGEPDNPIAPGGRLHPQRMIAEHGSAEAALQVLAYKLNDVEADNARYRSRMRELERTVPQGGRVLTAEEAGQWEAYQALGTPEALGQGIQQRDQFQGELETLRRDAVLREAAAAAGFKHSVLGRLADGLTVELRDGQRDGQAVQVPVVVADGKDVPLADYAAQHWGDFLPALQAQSQPGQGPQTTGTRFPAQHAGNGSARATSLVDKFQQEQAEKAKAVKNPLLRD